MSQSGHIIRPAGNRKTWSILYRDPTGYQRWEGKFPTKAKAQDRLAEVLGEINRGTYARPSALTFEAFAEAWLAGRRQIRGSTESGYGSNIKRQLISRLGSHLLTNLRFEHIDAAVSGMIEDELSSKTIHNVVTLLRTMLTGKKAGSAARRGLMIHDPTLGVELPPFDSLEIVAPTPEQAWTLINSAKAIGGIGYPATYIGAFTGFRRNEALGLRLCDVRWFNNELRVEHAISKRRGTDGSHKWEWYLGPVKTRRSRRSISVSESVMKLQGDLKVGKQDSDFILPEAGGGFIDPDKFSAEIWKPIAAATKMSGTRVHDLRRFFASHDRERRDGRLRTRSDGEFKYQNDVRYLRSPVSREGR
jgi:integrase